MTGSHRAERTRRRRGRPLQGLLVAGAVLVGASTGLGTFAYWNDVERVSGGTITAGTLDLTVEDAAGDYRWQTLTMTAMAPGESVAAELTIQNAGTIPFVVEMTGTASGGLAPYVTATAYVGGTATSDDTYPRAETCEGAEPGPARTLGPATQALASSVEVGTPTGRGGGEATLCIVLSLPLDTLPAAQGASLEPSFVITATQARS